MFTEKREARMNIEMSNIFIEKAEKGTMYGRFWLLNYNNLGVEFKCKNREIEFNYPYEDEKEQKYFSVWLLQEKEFYTSFLLNYLNEITKFNHITFSKGEIVREICREILRNKCYIIRIKYEQLPGIVKFQSFPSNGKFEILYRVPIAINSKREYAGVISIENILESEAVKRMWEPFRDKTKYRLQLLHVLR